MSEISPAEPIRRKRYPVDLSILLLFLANYAWDVWVEPLWPEGALGWASEAEPRKVVEVSDEIPLADDRKGRSRIADVVWISILSLLIVYSCDRAVREFPSWHERIAAGLPVVIWLLLWIVRFVVLAFWPGLYPARWPKGTTWRQRWDKWKWGILALYFLSFLPVSILGLPQHESFFFRYSYQVGLLLIVIFQSDRAYGTRWK